MYTYANIAKIKKLVYTYYIIYDQNNGVFYVNPSNGLGYIMDYDDFLRTSWVFSIFDCQEEN